MSKTKLTKMIEDLCLELKKNETVKENEAMALDQLNIEVRRLLESAHETKTDRMKKILVEQLNTAVGHFEETHPSLAANMEKVVDMLNKMGI